MKSHDPNAHAGTSCGPPDYPPHHGNSRHPHHQYLSEPSATRLLMTLVINFIIPIAQLVGGFFANSVALISDAVHNFSDFTAIFISYISLRISRKGASARLTFGYQRAEIIGALFNVAILICAVVFILYEALGRLYRPQTVSGELVIILAVAGIVGNGFSALLLYKDSRYNLNIRGAFLHMLGDFLTSIMVLIVGVVLLFRPWYWMDPILSFLIAVFILKNCWAVLAEAVSILMNAAPKGLDLKLVQEYLENLPGIQSAHYMHAWNLGSNGIAFSCHLTVSDRMISDSEVLAEKIRHHLFHQFGIDHPLIQFETTTCGNGTMLCELSKPELGMSAISKWSSIPKSIDHSKLMGILTAMIRLILGGIFIIAGAPKIFYPTEFAEALFNYQILPDVLINFVAITLPWVEVIIGGMLVVGLWMPGAILIYNGLMISFIAALAYNTYRGLDIHCGCFSSGSSDVISLETVLRDILILSMSLYLFYAVYFNQHNKDSLEMRD
jgi:cation diffusion facilitator family transporter